MSRAEMGSRPRLFLSCRGVAEERGHHRYPPGRRSLECVDHDELLHDPLVDRRGVALQHEYVAAANRVQEADEDLPVGEVEELPRRQAPRQGT